MGAFVLRGGRLAGNKHAGEVVAGGDDKVGVGLVVFEAGVEAGVDIFDQTVFGQQRFPFVFAGLRG